MDQATLTDRILTLRDKRVQGVMVPWRNVVTLPAGADRVAREALIRSRNFTRLPVVNDAGRVVGVLSWVDAVLDPGRSTFDLAGPALTFPADTRLVDALSEMRRARHTIAVVCRPDSKQPVGIVTMKDLVEPLTGELAAW